MTLLTSGKNLQADFSKENRKYLHLEFSTKLLWHQTTALKINDHQIKLKYIENENMNILIG